MAEATAPAHVNSDPTMKRAVQFSVVLHVVLFVAAIISGFVLPSKPLEITPSLRVDLVALPDFKKNDVPDIVPEAKEPPAEAPVVKPVEAPSKLEAKPDVGEKADVAIKNKTSKKEREQKTKAALTRMKALAALQQFKGNQISKGSVTSGEAKEALQTTYFDLVLEKVQSQWELPKWLQEKDLSAKVVVVIAKNGSIIQISFQKKSGDASFDNEVKQALLKAAPFPSPPAEIAADLMTTGILMGFPI